MMKICTKCLEKKTLNDFYFGADGFRQSCKRCGNKSAMEWQKQNPEKARAAQNRWRLKNAERIAIGNKRRVAKWQKAHPGLAATRARTWYRDNTSWAHANSKMQHLSRMNAVPKWANKFYIQKIYDLARLRTNVTGFKWHVDHIIPITSKLVCGLHVENNLQVIPASENLKKHNKFWPDMPGVT